MTPEWILALLEGAAIFIGVLKIAVQTGRVLEMIKDHDRRINRIEQHLDPHSTWLVQK